MDPVLERITYVPVDVQLGEIPWPPGLKPAPVKPPAEISGALHRFDYVVVTYTAAEGHALADVLTPGIQTTEWANYTHNWARDFEPHLTGRSPARDAKCMAYVCETKIGSSNVLCVKCNLHLSTDDKTLPVRALIKQIITETKPSLLITTGTAGGIGKEVLGDVLITAAAKFNCTETFKDEPWAQQRFESGFAYDLTGILEDIKSEGPSTVTASALLEEAFATMIPAAIGDKLKASGYASRDPEIVTGDVETVDYFAFADTDDSYGVVKNDPQAAMEEMDDAVIGLVYTDDLRGTAQGWCSVRNASDPQMGTGPLPLQKKDAENIYQRYGYFTTACSALAVWALVAGLAASVAAIETATHKTKIHTERVSEAVAKSRSHRNVYILRTGLYGLAVFDSLDGAKAAHPAIAWTRLGDQWIAGDLSHVSIDKELVRSSSDPTNGGANAPD